ncbi:ImmA/IrrE family metallo-endopeptidase [Sporosarcina limicola]|uniref:Zn-dependent peptidase ImmA (M78 family) n=1 Tax=Sporosarcina limicola TaxID=34101 RepID=A0A927MIV4_9BACL|nr:ImmA/IrrE family metallo-endopeptidase [Sporosarcina limicola]MBE1555514.1 Zn-dependent peptidase ImmA (M78 family) [Sporosarcina limicola]
MDHLMQEVERLADDYYKKYVSNKTSLMLADVLADIIVQQGIEVIYVSIPKADGEERRLNGMFFKHVNESVQPKIVINQLDTIRTQNFTLAHEWFHAILESEDMKKYAIQIQTKEEFERAGDYFSASILMNQEAFVSYFEIIRGRTLEYKVFKLADIFKVPYVSVVRRMSELDLTKVSLLGSLTEQELAELRYQQVGESVLDAPPKRIEFIQYQQLVRDKVVKGELSSLDVAKKLSHLNPKLAEEYFGKSVGEKDIDQLWNELDGV